MDLTNFDQVWLSSDGSSTDNIMYLAQKLNYRFPADFKKLYDKVDGFGASIKGLHIDFWDAASIVNFSENYEDVIEENYVFFASIHEGNDGFAYQVATNKIYTFPIECGVDDINEGTWCADDLDGLLAYWETLSETN